MSSIEERNVAALERWTYEVFEEGNLDLVEELMAPSYMGHGPAGTVVHTPESYPAVIESMRSNAPGKRYEIHDLIARGDRVALRYSTSATNPQTGKREQRSSNIGIWRLEDGRLAEYWVATRHPDAEPWPTAPRPREQWAIGSAETLTVDEEANLETLTRWADLYQNRSDDFEAVAQLVTDPYVTHGASGTSSERREEVVPFLVEFRELSPGYEGQFDDVFIVGDLAARRLSYRYPEPLPGRGSLQCGIAIYRFEDHRVAEYWNIYLPIDVGWE